MMLQNHERCHSNNNNSKKSIQYQLYMQFYLFILLFLLDVAINSSVEYDNVHPSTSTSKKNNDVSETSDTRNIQIILFGTQIILQIFVFINLFIAFSHTFLFQVGIVSICFKNFVWTLLMHPLYIFLTIYISIHRVVSFCNISQFYFILLLSISLLCSFFMVYLNVPY